MRRLVLCALLAATGAAAQEPGRVSSDVHVGRILVDLVVLAPDGAVIPGLRPADFVARVGGRPAQVEAADWIPAAAAEGPPVAADGTRNPPGRVIVFFVQNAMRGSQMVGLLRAFHAMAPLLDALLPTDRVAVLEQGGHLRLVQDLTADRPAVRRALESAILGGPPGGGAVDHDLPTLAETLDERTLRETPSVERGIRALGAALATLGGAKTVLFLGWGVAVNRAPSEYDALSRAVAVLRSARTSVVSLDATDADAHSLALGLQRVSAATGGSYSSLRNFPRQAIARVAQALAGRYVLVLVEPEGASGEITIELADRRGEVLSPW